MATPFITLALGTYPPATPNYDLTVQSGGSHGEGQQLGYDESDWGICNPGTYGVQKGDGGTQLQWSPIGGATQSSYTWNMSLTPNIVFSADDCSDTSRSAWTANAAACVNGSSGGTGWGVRFNGIVANRNIQETHFFFYADGPNNGFHAVATLADGSVSPVTLNLPGSTLSRLILKHRSVAEPSTIQIDFVKIAGSGAYFAPQWAFKKPSVSPQYPHVSFGP